MDLASWLQAIQALVNNFGYEIGIAETPSRRPLNKAGSFTIYVDKKENS